MGISIKRVYNFILLFILNIIANPVFANAGFSDPDALNDPCTSLGTYFDGLGLVSGIALLLLVGLLVGTAASIIGFFEWRKRKSQREAHCYQTTFFKSVVLPFIWVNLVVLIICTILVVRHGMKVSADEARCCAVCVECCE